MTPTGYALTQMEAEKFPEITIYTVAGDFWLADRDWNLLAGPSFKTSADAQTARSKALQAASKRFWRNEAKAKEAGRRAAAAYLAGASLG